MFNDLPYDLGRQMISLSYVNTFSLALEFDLFVVTFLLVRNFDGKTGADFPLQIIDVEVERSEVILIKFSDI